MKEIEHDHRASRLREEIVRLGPWHLDVQVTPEISTRAVLEAPTETYPPALGNVSFISPRVPFRNLLGAIYADGLEGRSFLDCACNCGAYSFWAKELGAGRCFGFDVREHWIEQARFLAANRTAGPTEGVNFEVMDLYELPNLDLEPFDVTLFKGIFYHLPDPITGLKAAADLTREVLILDTAIRSGLPDGMLVVAEESRELVMSGVHGLNWFPTGPNVISRILTWMGFAETRCVYWHIDSENQPSGLGRLQIIASRKKGILGKLESAHT